MSAEHVPVVWREVVSQHAGAAVLVGTIRCPRCGTPLRQVPCSESSCTRDVRKDGPCPAVHLRCDACVARQSGHAPAGG